MPRLFVIWISLACLFGPAAQAAQPDTLRMGSKRFTESYILGEILTQAAASHANTRHLPGLGNTAIAAARLGLDFVGIEMDEYYLNEAVDRIKALTRA